MRLTRETVKAKLEADLIVYGNGLLRELHEGDEQVWGEDALACDAPWCKEMRQYLEERLVRWSQL